MKKFLLSLSLALAVMVSVVEPLPVQAQSAAATFATKGDSLMHVAAAKLNVDTNASAQEIGEQLDNEINLIPGKHAGPLLWLKFLSKIFVTFIAIYFFFRRRAASIKLKAAGLLLLAVMVSVAEPLNAQTISADKLAKSPALKSLAVAPISGVPAQAVTAATPPATGHIIYATPAFGIGALTVTKSLDKWEATGTINPSFAYGIGVGEYTTNSDGSYEIQPYVSCSAFVAAGVIPQSILAGSFQVGGALGIYKYANVAAGYDVLTKQPFIALGASVSLFTFKQGLGSTVIKLF